MKDNEAREILGLDPQDDPRSFLPTFEETVQYKKELVENAPSKEIKFRYEQDLLEYQAAVKVVAGHRKLRPNTDFLAVLMLIGALSACGWWGYNWHQRQWSIDTKNQERIIELDSVGRSAIAKRKWGQAEEAYKEVLTIMPDSSIAIEGMESIRLGKLEERNQQLYYSLGESQAALEAGRWDEAEKLAKEVLEIDPENATAKQKLAMISEGKHTQKVSLQIRTITDAIDAEKIDVARAAMMELKKTDPNNAGLLDLTKRLEKAHAVISARKEKARALLDSARKLDTGEFSVEALELLVEARQLDPKNCLLYTSPSPRD